MKFNRFLIILALTTASVSMARGSARPKDSTAPIKVLSDHDRVTALVKSIGCSYEEGSSGLRPGYEGVLAGVGARRVEVYNHGANEVMPKVSVGDAKFAFYSVISRVVSEHPALGGNPDRGFQDHQVLNTALAVLMDNMTLVLPDGTLLSPNAQRLSLASLPRENTGKILASGVVEDAQVFLVDQGGYIIGPNMRPRLATASIGINGDVFPDENANEFISLAGLMTTKRAASLKVATLSSNESDLLQSRSELFGETEPALTECFQMLIKGDFANAKTCFSRTGNAKLAKATQFAKDAGIGGLRGGAAGAATGALVGGVGAGPGAAYGALGNVLTVVYNSFFRKEKLSLNQMQAIYECIAIHHVVPTETGELLPKAGKWYRTSMGMIRQGSLRIVEKSPGKFVKEAMMVDLGGNVVKKPVAFRLASGAEATGIKVFSRSQLDEKIKASGVLQLR